MDKEKRSFEENLSELEQVVKALESDKVTLDEMLSLFERGVTLTKECTSQLDRTERRINILVKKDDGTVGEEPFEGMSGVDAK